jgi:hypothetical protein
MLLSAAASQRFWSRTRPLTNAPARLVLRIAVAMPAMASASDLDRAHGGEMMRDDGEREQQRRGERPFLVGAARGDGERRHAERHAEHDRGDHQRRRPGDAPRQLDRGHAGIVHGGHAGADDAAADRRAPTARKIDRDRDAESGHQRRRHQRQRGEPDIVGDADAGIVGQHGDEMRRPDAGAGRNAGGDDPERARSAAGPPRAVEEVDRDQAGQETDHPGDDDQPPVMLVGEAGQDAIHVGGIRWLTNGRQCRATRCFVVNIRLPKS